jgi:hypothetical protein
MISASGRTIRGDKISHSVLHWLSVQPCGLSRGNIMKKYLIVALLASLLAGCAHDSPACRFMTRKAA